MKQDDDEIKRDRDAKGRFAVGHKPLPNVGRPLGALNKLSKSVRERVIEGFDDPNARDDGIADFVRDLKATHPPAAAGLLANFSLRPSLDIDNRLKGQNKWRHCGNQITDSS